MPKTTLTVLVLVILIGLWFPYYAFTLGPADDEEIESQTFSIQKGNGLEEVAKVLEERELIRSASIFKLYNFLNGKAHQLKPGLYQISASMSVPEMVELFTEGPNNKATVLLYEGKTVNQTDELLADLGILNRGELNNFDFESLVDDYFFLSGRKSLEGFLFPDTYEIALDADVETVVRKMLDAFNDKTLNIIQVSGKDLYEIITIASMIEREVPDSEERKIVSGIIQSRLELGMALQIDATLLYAKDHGDAYDTYEFAGLPPGPIANPGLDAIKAAIAPTDTDYLYYLSHPETGETLFSETFEEHDTKRAEYLR